MIARRTSSIAAAGLAGLLLGACAARPHDASAANEAEQGAVQPTTAPAIAAPTPGEIQWTPYDEAFTLARREGKPVVMVFTATWCGHCRTYQGVLSNPEVVDLSRQLVMVRVDIDQHPDVNARFQDDGGYVPRTHFFRADGSPLAALRAANRTRYVHFLDTHDPHELLSLMRRALES